MADLLNAFARYETMPCGCARFCAQTQDVSVVWYDNGEVVISATDAKKKALEGKLMSFEELKKFNGITDPQEWM